MFTANQPAPQIVVPRRYGGSVAVNARVRTLNTVPNVVAMISLRAPKRVIKRGINSVSRAPAAISKMPNNEIQESEAFKPLTSCSGISGAAMNTLVFKTKITRAKRRNGTNFQTLMGRVTAATLTILGILMCWITDHEQNDTTKPST